MSFLKNLAEALNVGLQASHVVRDGFAAMESMPQRMAVKPQIVDDGVIERLCEAVGYNIVKRRGNTRVLAFDGRGVIPKRPMYVAQGGIWLLFSCFSDSSFTPESLPPMLPTVLLRRNDEATFGGWQMDVEDGEVTLNFHYCVPLEMVNPELFQLICDGILEEAHAVDAELKRRGLLQD